MSQSETQTSTLNKKSKPIGTLYPDPSHKQGHTKTQNKGFVEDIPIKWREKKKPGVVTLVSDKIDYDSNKD